MKRIVIVCGLLLFLAACGTSEAPSTSGDVNEEVKKVSDREIIVSLAQTADPVKRDETAAAIKESQDFKEGYMGEPTEELAADMAVQQIEAEAMYKAVDQVYGSLTELEKEGVFFLENKTSGADQPGIWMGIKNPDERVDELAAILQKQVDASEILAEPIYIYRSAHTRAELNDLVDQAAKKVKAMSEDHPNPEAISSSFSADTITGALEIGHNFLTDDQIGELENAFPDREVIIRQEGVMVPLPGEPTVSYPEPAVTPEPSGEGDYIVQLEADRFLAIEAVSQDFSANGGEPEFYSAIYFNFADAAELLEIGQRVKVAAAGPIMESYPGQGRAVFVEVLPAYQPEGADLSEDDVVKKALESLDQQEFGTPAVRAVTFDQEADRWLVEIKSWEQETEITIDDKK